MNNYSILKSSILILIISNFGNLFQYLIQLVLGRALSPPEFGVYNTVNSIFVVLMAFTVVISYVTAREIIKISSDQNTYTALINDLVRKSALASLAVGALFAVLAPDIAAYFTIGSATPIQICAAIMSALIMQAVFTGIMQGMARYMMLSIVQTIQVGVRLLLIIFIVVVLKYSYNGALLGVFLSCAAVILFYLYYLRDHVGVRGGRVPLPTGIYRSLFHGAVPMALMWAYMGIISNIDIPIVKHFLPDHEAGIYSAGAVLGRIAWFIPSMLVFVLFPEVVRSDVDGRSSAWHAAVITSITFIISFGIATVFALIPKTILMLLMGGKYAEGGPVLAVVSFSMAIVAILSVLYNFCLAKKMVFFLWPAYGILISCITLIYWRFHASSIEIANVFLIGLIFTAVINAGQFIIRFWSEIQQHLAKIRSNKISFRSAS